jgi:arylsulfatase A-like enzyme
VKTRPFDRLARWLECDGSQRSTQGLRSALERGAALGTLTGSIAALIDAAATLLSGFQGDPVWFLFYSWALLVLWTGCLGIAFAGWLELLRAAFERGPATERSPGRRRARWLLRCTAAGLPVLAFVCWVPSSWVLEHWQELAPRGRALVILTYLLLFLGTLGSSLVSSWLARRHARADPPRLLRLLPAALLLLAGACYVADRVILVGLYEDFHYGLFGGFLLSLAACVVLGAAALRHARPHAAAGRGRGAAWAVVLLLVAGGIVGGCEFAALNVFGPSQSLAFSKLVATGRALTDFDRDGVSGLFGGSDCDGFDEASGPGQFDLPGNGVDEDCSGGDALWPKPRPRLDYPVPDRSGHDVVIITVDALRADHLGFHGYPRNTSPNLDALARRSLVFERAFSAAPKTYDALPALFSGLYPSNIARDYARKDRNGHWRKTNFDQRDYVYEVGADTTLLAERFQRRGYHTIGCSYVALLPLLGLARGFDRFVQARSCRAVLTRAKDRPEPLFFWVHLFAPHAPYVRHPEFDFGTATIDRYDSEVAGDDAEIGALLALLDQRGRADRTITVVSADHGEEFREHGGEFHGLRLYRELLHVPLLLQIPGVEPARVAAPVEILGLVPTLCELVGLEGPCDGYDAVSLLRTLHHPGQAPGAVAEVHRRGSGAVLRSLYTERWHLLLDLPQDRVELYDVELDRNEQHDVARQHPEIVSSMREELQGRLQYRAARLFEAYASDPDPVRLARGLPLLQDERLLERALHELEQRPGPALTEHLKQLADRPGLRDDLRARALAAAAQPQAAR